MAWTTITAAAFTAEGFNATERTRLQTAAGGDDGLQDILDAAIAEWRALIQAAGTTLDADATKIPPSCRRHIIAQCRWQVLLKFPDLRQMQTEERKDAAKTAEDVLEAIAKGDRPVEVAVPVAADIPQSGNYGSETKIQMHTHVTPEE